MKSSIFLLALSLMTLTLTACSNEGPSTVNNAPVVDDSEAAYPAGDYVGMTVPQAQAKAKAEGVPFRITMADGEAFALTEDYRIGRINAVIENGVIVSYSVEGEIEEASATVESTLKADEVTASSRGRQVVYLCDGANEFTVSYSEYVSGDAVMKLEADQVMFSDAQTRTASVMNRTVAASGEKYESAEGLVFWSKGLTALVMQGEENVYENCEQV